MTGGPSLPRGRKVFEEALSEAGYNKRTIAVKLIYLRELYAYLEGRGIEDLRNVDRPRVMVGFAQSLGPDDRALHSGEHREPSPPWTTPTGPTSPSSRSALPRPRTRGPLLKHARRDSYLPIARRIDAVY